MEKWLQRAIGIILGALIAFVLSMAIPTFVKSAAACGGWWDPCCGGSWSEDRCAAFNAKKRQQAAENEAYFARMEERLKQLADYAGWLPAGGLAAKALNEAAKAAKAAKEANGAVARGAPSDSADYAVRRQGPTYTDTGYEWVNNLNSHVVDLFNYGNYAAYQAQQYHSCREQGYEDWCDRAYGDNANWGLSVVGWLHGEMAYDMEVIAWQVENENGNAWPYGDISWWLRDAAAVSYDTEGAFQ